ncbi:MAG TPA: hypothetical protein VGS27_10620 [Candidatus Sulfotelmatobacter sp.]|nr:hypothetical protein [Candidatus Sulfotelmatobacter sp.]
MWISFLSQACRQERENLLLLAFDRRTSSIAPATERWYILSHMDKKQINSPKLTANFMLWICLFLLAVFLLIGHFLWKIF